MVEANGPWKEGRVGAVSLCYLTPTSETLAWVMQHHAAVGIRATLAGAIDPQHRQLAAERNWDLAHLATEPSGASQPEASGLVIPDPQTTPMTAESWRYRLIRREGHIAAPTGIDPQQLPMQPAPGEVAAWRVTIDRIATAGGWSIWCLDEPALASLGPADHEALLTWLGTEHARIWCAPVRDIANWAT